VRGRGCAVGVLGVIAGLAVLGGAGDVGARHLATSKIEQRVRQRVPEASRVHARIHSWPFLKVAVNGDIDELGVTATRVVERPLVFTDVDVDLRGVRLSVTDLLTSGSANVTHIRRGTVALSVTEPNLVQAIVAQVPAAKALLGSVPLLGRVTVTVDAAHRTLVVAAPGLPSLTLPLPGTNILPCTPTVQRLPDRVRLACTFNRVPDAFTSAVSG
jgi:DUF2993 family protein